MVRILTALVLIMFVRLAHAQQELPHERQSPSLVDKFSYPGGFGQSADRTADQILKQLPLTDSPTGSDSLPNNQQTTTSQSEELTAQQYALSVEIGDETRERQQFVKQLRELTSQYLAWYKTNRNDLGLDRVEARHLDLTLLKFRQQSSRRGSRDFTVVFDEQFHAHVRARGRQFAVKDQKRLRSTVFVCATVFAALLFIYGTLKVLAGRSKQQGDFIATGRISMV